MRRVDRLLAVLIEHGRDATAVPSPGPGDVAGLGLDALSASRRPREWDAFATAEAPGLPGSTMRFYALESGEVVPVDDVPAGSATPLAEALRQLLEPPFQAAAARVDGDVWCAIAESVQILELPGLSGDELEVTDVEGRYELRVDGEPDARIPAALLELVGADGDSVVTGDRIDERRFAVRMLPL